MKYNLAEFENSLAISRRLADDVVELRESERKMQEIRAGATPPGEPPTKTESSGFGDEAAAMISDVRTNLLAMLEAGGTQIVKSRDVQKLFGVDASLSWQVFKLFKANDLLSASQFVPPAVSMQKIFGAARKKGIQETLINSATTSFERFEAFVTKHAGGRSRFESMSAALSQGDDVQQAAIQQRKQLFKAHTFFWGVELGTQYSASILAPNEEPGSSSCKLIHITNMLEFHRLRPNADTHVLGYGTTFSSTELPPQPPLDQEAWDKHGAPVLPEFSAALPLLKTVTDHWGRSRIILTGEAVGLTSSVDLAFATVFPNLGEYVGDFEHRGSVIVVRPTQRLYIEFLVHREKLPKLRGSAKTYGHVSMGAAPQDMRNPAWELPSFEKVTYERSIDEARLIGVPRRRELLTHCCEKMGWNVKDFDVYRLDVEYPIIDTNTVVTLSPL